MLFPYLFFIPGIISICEFIVFLFQGKKPMKGPLGFILDTINIIGFPALYASVNIPYMSQTVFMIPPFFQFTTLVVTLCIISYFLIRYFSHYLPTAVQIIALCLVGIGIFLNMAMLFREYNIFSFFHVPIILLFIIQIVEKSNSLIKT
jgi:hypothetical protein